MEIFSEADEPPSGVAKTTQGGLIEHCESKAFAIRTGRLKRPQRYGGKVQLVLTVTFL